MLVFPGAVLIRVALTLLRALHPRKPTGTRAHWYLAMFSGKILPTPSRTLLTELKREECKSVSYDC